MTVPPTAIAPNETLPTLLIVDDDAVLRERLSRAFERRGFAVTMAPDGTVAIALAELESPEYALVDMRMPGPSGLEVVRELVRIDPDTRIVVLTAYGSIATAIEAIRLGATYYLQKPASIDQILAAFERGKADGPDRPPAPTEVPSLARAEWEHIHQVLSDCQGNIRQAARLLGLHRRTLQRKLSKFPLSR